MKNNKYFVLGTYLMVCLCAIGVVPASVFLCQIPDKITWILCVFVMISLGYSLRTVVKRMGSRILLIITAFFTIAVSILGNYCNPYWNSLNFKSNVNYNSKSVDTVLTSEEALEDLRYAMYYLNKLHPAFYDGMPKEIEQRYEEVTGELSAMEEITVCELSRRIESVFALLRDGHTYVKARDPEQHYMKDIYSFSRRGYVLTAINGIEMTDLVLQTKGMYSFEMESWQKSLLSSDLTNLEGLQYLGFSAEDGIAFTFEAEDGSREEHTYYEEDFLKYEEYVAYNNITQGEAVSEAFVYYEINEENSLGILTLNSCVYNEEYRRCVEVFFTEVKEKNVANVAVDLRENGGGNSMVTNEFIRYLNVDSYKGSSNSWRFGCFRTKAVDHVVHNDKREDLLFHGNVYVLTSERSFSSAMLFAQYIKDNHLGILIGEAPGNVPNGYGEVATFKMPNSQIAMQISTKEFFRADRENPVNAVEPDVPCDSEDAMKQLYAVLAEE